MWIGNGGIKLPCKPCEGSHGRKKTPDYSLEIQASAEQVRTVNISTWRRRQIQPPINVARFCNMTNDKQCAILWSSPLQYTMVRIVYSWRKLQFFTCLNLNPVNQNLRTMAEQIIPWKSSWELITSSGCQVIPRFMEPKGSLPCSQQPVMEPDKSSPPPQTMHF